MFVVFGSFLLFVSYIIIDGNNRSKWPYLVSANNDDGQFQTNVTIDHLDPENNVFKYHIDTIDTGYSDLTDYDTLCINQITANLKELNYTSWSYNNNEVSKGVGGHPSVDPESRTVPLTKELCKSKSTHFKVGSDNSRSPADYIVANIEDTAPIIFYRYFYPYDEIDGDISIRLPGYYQYNQSRQSIEVKPNIDWYLDMPGWELAYAQASETTLDAKLEFKLQRPYVYRLITPLLALCTVIFIFSIPFIRDLGSLAQVATGLVIGLWSIRQVVLTPDIKWPTILDPIFVLLYTFLGISILLRMFVAPRFFNAPSETIQSENVPEINPSQKINKNNQNAAAKSIPLRSEKPKRKRNP